MLTTTASVTKKGTLQNNNKTEEGGKEKQELRCRISKENQKKKQNSVIIAIRLIQESGDK